MKKLLLVLIILALAPLSVLAQTPVEREIQQLGLKGVSFTIAAPEPSAAVGKVARAAAVPFGVNFSHETVYILPNMRQDTNVTIHHRITNLTDDSLIMGFVRTQELPSSWSSSVCFGINCYASHISSKIIRPDEAWAPGEARELVMHVRTPPGAQGTGNIRLALFSPTTGDTIAVTYTVIMEPLPLVPCRTFWIYNPYNGDIDLSEVTVENPELFDVEVLSDTTYPIYEGYVAVRLCLKKEDGAQYSTNVVVVSDSGTFKQEITMQAPTAGVKPSVEVMSGIRIVSVSPNPASASQQIEVNLESNRNADLTFTIVDLLGRELRSVNSLGGSGYFGQKLSVTDLSAGSYMILVKENGVVLDQASFNIAR